MRRCSPIIVAILLVSACGSTSTESVTSPSAPKCLLSLAGPTGTLNATGGSGTVSVSAQPECEWTAAVEAVWITELAPVRGQGNGQVQFQVVANPSGTPRESAVAINGQRALVRQDAAACELTLTITDNHFPSSGGTGTIAIATPQGCAWTAASTVGWIAASPLSGSGNGNIAFTVAANTGADRTGTITAGGQAITISQAAAVAPPPVCTITLQPLSASMPASGGIGSVGITTNAGCPWTAISTVAWITLTTATSGSGNGSVGFNVAANTGGARTGTLTIGGQTFTVSQAAAAPACTFSIAPTSQSVPAAGATGIAVAVTAATGCAWTTTSNAAWITVTAGSSGSGNGTVRFNVAANTGGARTGTLTIATQTFTVSQAAAAPCTFSINPTSQSVPAAGATGIAVAVTAATGCAWTATSNAAWITVTAGSSGSGNGTVMFNAAANTGGARTGTLTIATQTFTVNQAAGTPPCTFSIAPTSITVGSEEVLNLSVAVTTASGCAWTAVSNNGFIHISAGSPGSGNGTVTYSVDKFNGASRTGTMTIAGQTFTVTQVRCSATLNPQTQAVSALGGSFTVAVTTQIGCPWQAVESLSWVTITSGSSGTGSGTVGYTVAPNLTGARSGSVAIADETFTVNQAAP